MSAGGRLRTTVLVAAILVVAGWAYWKFAIPTHRIEVRSELIMLGDLDGDHRWTSGDLVVLDADGTILVHLCAMGRWARWKDASE